MTIPILYEDNHLLVVVKPVNIPSQEDESRDADMLTLLKEDIKQRYNKPGNVFLGLVHRLDRPVGGAMVFAKTSKAASRLSDQIRTRRFEKRYLAVIHGKPKTTMGTLRHYLIKDPSNNLVRTGMKHEDGAKEAILDYEVIGNSEAHSLISIHLQTGRPHQIRVQLSTIGCPLYGDQKYGTNLNKPGQQLALWSASLGIEHPITKEYLHFRSQPPRSYPWNLWPEISDGGDQN
jgi:23S rRNA pseudouridine1911/1915/1917 synthase